MDSEMESALREYISGKNVFAAEQLLTEAGVSAGDRRHLLAVTELIGPGSTLDDAAEEADNERSLRAVSRLRIVYDILKLYGVEDYVSFDLSMLSKYNYYTGIIFRGFTYGVGDVVASGGRYDNLLGHFGKDAPAIGFMIPVDTLMEALRRQHREVKIPQEAVTVTYDGENFEEKLDLVEKLRRNGTSVRLIPEKPMQEQ